MATGVSRVWRTLKRSVFGRPIFNVRARLAKQYLRGEGLEIGALHAPLPLPRGAIARYVDRLPVSELRKQYLNLAGQAFVPVDVVDDGETLATMPDDSQDFVIANHFLEHTEDPIGTLKAFFRVLRFGGVVFLGLPDKRYTFDCDRPLTPLAHLLADHLNGPQWTRREHFQEFARLVERCESDDAVQRRADELMANGTSIHFHVWTQREMLELLLWVQRQVSFDIETVVRNKLEVLFILRKA